MSACRHGRECATAPRRIVHACFPRTGAARRTGASHTGAKLIEALSSSFAAGIIELLALSPPGWGGNSAARPASIRSMIAVGAFGLGLLIGIGGAYGKLYGGPVAARPARGLHDARARRAGAGADPAALFCRHRPDQPRCWTAIGYQRDRHQRPRGRHLRARLRAGRLFDRGHPRRDPGDSAGPDRGGARLRHVARPAAAAHHPAGHAALRHSRPRQSLADRHQGHGAAGHRRLQRTDAGDAAGGRRRPRPISPSSSRPACSICC